MSYAIEQTMVVAVTTARPLTKEQRTALREDLHASLPSTAFVILLDKGMTADVFPLCRDGVAVPSSMSHEMTAQILAELKRLRAELAVQPDLLAIDRRPLPACE